MKSRGQCRLDNTVLYYPSAAGSAIDGLVTVGGVDRQNHVWAGSCTGSSIDILAPAENLLVASISGHNRYRGFEKSADGMFVEDFTSGTSYAAPYVSAIAARMLESDPTLTPVEIEQRMKASLSTRP